LGHYQQKRGNKMKHRYKQLGKLSLANVLRARQVRKGNGAATNQKSKPPMKAKSSRFDSLVARYYPAVYGVASRLTDDPREAIALTRDAFNSTRRQLQNLRDETTLASILILAVIRAGLAAA
jgi:hypothetical protein